eukprot:CAMPEP_0169269652 /NCGR_PEP_ID=MMETSP1016-20121227/48588_1 /TAXON_ID=342587 /ORGANISM="Karlodinium micrum, Strain CCMP2283" /LENGTH=142 /DNA_ID=CAMNT_0009354725 /DNA_START=44 /DNA_END=468 /DNA_ORIENTATION=+
MPCRYKIVRTQFFKTELCRFHLKGRCRKGTLCEFAHDESELCHAPDLTKTSLCELWQQGKCTKDASLCQFAHGQQDLRRTLAWCPDNAKPDAVYVGLQNVEMTIANLLDVLKPPHSRKISLADMARALMIGFDVNLDKDDQA